MATMISATRFTCAALMTSALGMYCAPSAHAVRTFGASAGWVYTCPTPKFTDLDLNKDGFITASELMKARCSDMQSGAQKILQTVDDNHDQKISPTEFQAHLEYLTNIGRFWSNGSHRK